MDREVLAQKINFLTEKGRNQPKVVAFYERCILENEVEL